MVVIDNDILSLLLHPKARPPKDPATNKPIERLPDRIEKLIEDWEGDQEKVIIPAPVLSEFLILAGDEASNYLDEISARRTILIKPFDQMAAIELAAIELEARKSGSKRGSVTAPWTKVKFDRQIVAIAKVNGATRIYSNDGDVRKFADKVGIETVSAWELPLPTAKQMKMYDEEETNATAEQADNKLKADPAHPAPVQRSDSGRAQGEAAGEADIEPLDRGRRIKIKKDDEAKPEE
jgi:predicted nucleic acid-binding protein